MKKWMRMSAVSPAEAAKRQTNPIKSIENWLMVCCRLAGFSNCGMNWIAFLSLWVIGGLPPMLRKERENKSNSMNGAQRPQAHLISLLLLSSASLGNPSTSLFQSKKLIEWKRGLSCLFFSLVVGYGRAPPLCRSRTPFRNQLIDCSTSPALPNSLHLKREEENEFSEWEERQLNWWREVSWMEKSRSTNL